MRSISINTVSIAPLTPAIEVSCCDMRCIVSYVLIPTLLVTMFTALATIAKVELIHHYLSNVYI